MAGMLPGVESARRRRFHQAHSLHSPNSRIDLTLGRRWNLSLYETNRDHYHQSQKACPQQQLQTHITPMESSHIPSHKIALDAIGGYTETGNACFRLKAQGHKSPIVCDMCSIKVSLTIGNYKEMRSESQSEQKGDNKLHEDALEARERLEERLRPSALGKKRHNPLWHRHLPHDYSNMNNGEHHMICSQNEARPLSNTDGHSFGGSVTEARRPTDLASQNFKPSSPGLSKSCFDLIQREIFIPVEKTKGKHWIKIKLRASEQEDCSVCLESFQADQVLIRLPCTHRFHSDCLIPWLDSHSHCPYCRMKISIKTF